MTFSSFPAMLFLVGLVLALIPSRVSALSSSPASVSLSPNQRALQSLPPFPRTWVPLASVFELDGKRPNKVEFLGQNYVCFQTNTSDISSWTVMDDACPHRLAPLSEGRIITADSQGHEITKKQLKSFDGPTQQLVECSYHGWAFDEAGQCVRIPQATPELQQRTIQNNPNCHVRSYSTRVCHNILFCWPWPEDCLAYVEDDWRQPEYMSQSLSGDSVTYTRDAQYGWDTLLENIVDLSHLPWAHHGQQGTRDDAVVMNVTLASPMQEKGLDFLFDDRTMAYDRSGTIHFRAPYLMSIVSDMTPTKPKQFARAFNFTLVLIPTKPGWSRIIACGGPGSRSKQATASALGVTKKQKKTLITRVFSILPRWMIHQLTHRILDSDIVLLHNQDQERTVKRQVDYEGYCMPAAADRAIAPIRRWVRQFAHIPSLSKDGVILPKPPVTRSALFDRWSQHTDQCQHCHGAYEGVKKWRKYTFWALAASILSAKFLAARVVAIACLALLQSYNVIEKSMTQGGIEHYKNH